MAKRVDIQKLKGVPKLKYVLKMAWNPFTKALQELSELEISDMLEIELTNKNRSSYIDRIRARLVALNQEKINEQIKERTE